MTRNRRLMVVLFLLVGGMIGLSYAAVPLYDLFCRVTGFGGTTGTAEQASTVVSDRTMKVRFDSMINDLDWDFRPSQGEIAVRVGETTLAHYRADNRANEATTGIAVFNVTPLKVGQYFKKIECFCFNEQRLEVGSGADMPVLFFVDPAIEEDPNLDDVKTITLSYTFYPA